MSGRIRSLIPACAGVLAITVARPLAAQCPDGTPPPCGAAAARAPAANSVAVLPFRNLSRDTSLAYLGDALADEITVALAGLKRFELKSSSQVRDAQHRAGRNPRAFARMLGARYLLEGSFLAETGRMRVTVQVSAAATGDVRWSRSFNRPAADVGALLDTVSTAVAAELGGALLPEERRSLQRRAERDAGALRLYWQGQAIINSRYDSLGFRQAIGLFERAVARDSGFADAWAAIAQSWGELADSWLPPLEAYPPSTRAALRALQLDSSSVAAWYSLTAARLSTHDVAGAALAARRAMAADSDRVESAVAAAFASWAGNRPDDGVGEILRVWNRDTTSYFAFAYVFYAYYMAHRFDEVEAFVNRYRSLVPPEDFGVYQGAIAEARHQCAPAIATLSRASGLGSVRALWLGVALACAGRRTEALAVADSLAQAVAHGAYVPADAIAAIRIAAGDTAGGYTWLERAYREGALWVSWMDVGPWWDGLRGDPRFRDVARRAGLPEPTRP